MKYNCQPGFLQSKSNHTKMNYTTEIGTECKKKIGLHYNDEIIIS